MEWGLDAGCLGVDWGRKCKSLEVEGGWLLGEGRSDFQRKKEGRILALLTLSLALSNSKKGGQGEGEGSGFNWRLSARAVDLKSTSAGRLQLRGRLAERNATQRATNPELMPLQGVSCQGREG